jgi:predicted kinase
MPTATILRGVPGAGKSYYAANAATGRVVSSDRYFVDEFGNYRFDLKKVSLSHAWCFDQFLNVLGAGEDVVVDNTNIHTWEWHRYYKTALLCKYDVQVVEFMPISLNDLRMCAQRCVHEVPHEIIGRMAIDFEPVDYSICPGLKVHRFGINADWLKGEIV